MLVGYGAWAIVIPMVVGVLKLAGRKVLPLGRTLAGLGLYVSLLSLVQLALRPGGAFSPGGLVGRGVVALLEASTGSVGAVFVLMGCVLLSATILFRLDWRHYSARMVDTLEIWIPRMLHWAVGVARSALNTALSVLRWSGLMAFGMSRWSGQKAWGATRWSGKTAVNTSVGFCGRFYGAVQRIVASFKRSEFDGPDVDWATASELDDMTGGPDSLPPSQVDDPTQVASPAILAEVEWNPTTAGPEGSGAFVTGAGMGPLPVSAGPVPMSTGFGGGHSSAPSTSAPRIELRSPTTPTAAPLSAVSIQSPSDFLEEPEFSDERPLYSEVECTPAAAPVVVAVAEPEPAPALKKRVQRTKKDAAKKEELQDTQQEQVFDAVEVSPTPYLDLRHRDDGKALQEGTGFQLPPLDLLDLVPEQRANVDELELQGLAIVIEEKLKTFKVGGKVVGVRPGPVVTIYEFLPDPGVKISRVSRLSDDLMMALKATSLRIVAPIPGRGVVGIEVPSKDRLTIYLREIMASPIFRRKKMKLPCVLGKDVEGKPLVEDLAKMPHLLIGGSTGSGKSVGVNGMLMSLLFSLTPDDLRLILVDPKMLEFQLYRDIPHLLHPVITDAKLAAGALAWACVEMDRRYDLIARWEVRNLESYNSKVESESKDWTDEKARSYAPRDWPEYETPPAPEKLPYIVIVIDELADLMIQARKEVEDHIARLAAKARACGIHLVIATQRPSVDVLTGVIKTNLPTRIAYKLQSSVDSRTVVNAVGAEKLLGKGDLLFIPPGSSDLVRGHGPFVSDGEVKRICDHLRAQKEPEFIDVSVPDDGERDVGDERHPKYREAVEFVVSKRKASTSMIQRALGIGYNKAAGIIDCMEADGFVGPADGARPRKVLIEEAPDWL